MVLTFCGCSLAVLIFLSIHLRGVIIPLWVSLSFQNLLTPLNSLLESLHDLVMVWLLVIILIVSIVKVGALSRPQGFLVLDNKGLEQFWTLAPMAVLVSVAWPSINLLCLQDSQKEQPFVDLKIISNQWNWSSECWGDEAEHLLDVEETDYLGSLENPIFIGGVAVRVTLTSTDVLHSLGVPRLGLKLDSIPGRLNSVVFLAIRPGMHVGSCYELCGRGHSAIPLRVLRG